MANILLDHSNPPSPSLMYSSPSSSLSDSLDDPFMDYIQANDHDNSNDFYSVAHSDGMPSPPPPPSHDRACFQTDQIIIPEGDHPKVEQADVFDVCNGKTKKKNSIAKTLMSILLLQNI
jgi:hypothetical protein